MSSLRKTCLKYRVMQAMMCRKRFAEKKYYQCSVYFQFKFWEYGMPLQQLELFAKIQNRFCKPFG